MTPSYLYDHDFYLYDFYLYDFYLYVFYLDVSAEWHCYMPIVYSMNSLCSVYTVHSMRLYFRAAHFWVMETFIITISIFIVCFRNGATVQNFNSLGL